MATLFAEAERYASLLIEHGYADDPSSYDTALVRVVIGARGG
jgi:hypothetical protein